MQLLEALLTTRRSWLAGIAGTQLIRPSQLLRAQPKTSGVTRAKIDAGQIVARLNPMIFGQFTEHLGRCIYGGIYEEGSALSDGQGFRKDVLTAVRRLNPPVIRWPGGNFASSYHWEDGIGPKDQRPARFDSAWFARESNRFGSNEFIDYCRRVQAEPYLCINLGTGTIQEAANGVENCNRAAGGQTASGAARREHRFPYGGEANADRLRRMEHLVQATRWARSRGQEQAGRALQPARCAVDGIHDPSVPTLGRQSHHG